MDNPEIDLAAPALGKKLPRKPRPSEIAAKLAKAAGKKPAKVAKKPSKKAPAKKQTPRKPKTVKRPAKKRSGARPLVRTARLDIRATPAERKKIAAIAKRRGTTITAVVMETMAKIK